MRLDNILKGIEILETTGNLDMDIADVTSDSRQCSEGCLFIAIDGFESDGHAYIRKAAESTASRRPPRRLHPSGSQVSGSRIPELPLPI